jgi:asparagine synthase (glutamine-hydrolysing)
MCGITGFIDSTSKTSTGELTSIVTRMSEAITHRGPDDSGTWVDARHGVAFGFRRLAIIDTSPAGHQPMVSAGDRFVIIFNGEIYNYEDLRKELMALGHSFKGHSDTEAMLAGFTQWGIDATIGRLNGQFAIALWDRRENTLTLIRDRLGVKPMYYGWMGKTFLFGSELKALQRHPDFQGEIDRNSLALFMRHNCIPAPYSIYKGIEKLRPGTCLTLKMDDRPEIKTSVFWSAKNAVEAGVSNPFDGSDAEALDLLDNLLSDSVKKRMIADVPLGAFLSGGIDSSTIVALMQKQSDRPVKTFTIGFNEPEYNEAEHASQVAKHLGTEHTEMYVTPEEAQAVIPHLARMYDEPFSDVSQIPTYLVSKLTRQHVTVSLSGDGGDELFAGYNRYNWGKNIWKAIGWMPGGLRQAAAATMRNLSPSRWDRLFKANSSLLPADARVPNPGDKMHKIAEIMGVRSKEALYTHLVSHWKHPEELVIGSKEPPTILTDRNQWADVPDFTRWMMYQDLVGYMTDDILVKVDRASMATSLEARVPFIDDHRVVEFAWRLPLSMKMRNGKSKWILRQLLYRYVPQSLIERPKMGFGVPIDSWLRGPLRDWAEDLLDESRMKAEGYLNPTEIRLKWSEHLNGGRNWQYYLWDILIFQDWLRQS